MKSRIFKLTKGGGSYFMLDSRGVKWTIDKEFLPKVLKKGREGGVSFWIAESELNESFREKNKKTILKRIEELQTSN